MNAQVHVHPDHASRLVIAAEGDDGTRCRLTLDTRTALTLADLIVMVAERLERDRRMVVAA